MKIKNVILVITLLVSALASTFAAQAFGLPPIPTIGGGVAFTITGASVLRGAMPMAINVTSDYAGEVLEQLLVRATTGNEIVEGGHIHVQPECPGGFVIPRLKVGQMLQRRKEQPVDSDSKGNFDVDEKKLNPEDVMAFTTFNPRAFESFWRPFQPKGNLVFSQLPPEVQNQFLAELAKVVNFELGGHIINGEYHETAEGKFFDGIITRIVADTDVIKITSPVAITEDNILAKLKLVKSAMPKSFRNATIKKNVKIFMSTVNADMYDYVLTEKPFKGVDYSAMSPEMFKGYQIVPLSDWPDDVIVAAYSTPDRDSNFWMGVNYANDADVIQIDKLTNAGEKYFFKMLMKVDTNIVFGEDIVLYDGREAEAPAGGGA